MKALVDFNNLIVVLKLDFSGLTSQYKYVIISVYGTAHELANFFVCVSDSKQMKHKKISRLPLPSVFHFPVYYHFHFLLHFFLRVRCYLDFHKRMLFRGANFYCTVNPKFIHPYPVTKTKRKSFRRPAPSPGSTAKVICLD